MKHPEQSPRFWQAVYELAGQAGLRLTSPRRQVLEAVVAAGHPRSAAELAHRCGLHKVTTYRSLQHLEAAGLLKRVRFEQQRAERWELADQLGHHHHHIVCDRCGKIAAVEGCGTWFARLQVPGFSHVRHQLEFYGRCRACGEGA